jgi:hypothetical protein
MFEPAEKRSDRHIRLRKIALGVGAASLLIFIALNIWYEVKGSEFEDSIFPYYPGDFEVGLTFGAILGGIFAAVLLAISLIMGKSSK